MLLDVVPPAADSFPRVTGPSSSPSRRVRLTLVVLIGASTYNLAGIACRRGEPTAVHADAPIVLYASIDEPIAQPVLDAFRKQSGVNVSVVFDSEAGKTTGLVNRIVAEAKSERVRADVFWSGEVFQTIRLAREGLLASHEVASAEDIPRRFKDEERRWTGFGLRARVLAYDSAHATLDELPRRWEDVAAPAFAKNLAIANPLFGTTRGHVASMFAVWDVERGRNFLTGIRESGALIVDGNSAAVRAVIDGRVKYALTDSDDVWLARKVLPTLSAAYLDLGDGGTLLIPCTVALLRGGPNPDGGRRLVEFLASSETERMLARSEARFIPVREALREELGVDLPPASVISFDSVADSMDDAAKVVREILIR